MKRKNIRDEGLTCLTMLALGVSNATFVSREIRRILALFTLAVLVFGVLVYFLHLPSAQDREREDQDERNQMIQEKASYYSRQAEDWILIGLFAVFGCVFQRFEIAYAFMWFMVGRFWLSFGIRWWLNRKY